MSSPHSRQLPFHCRSCGRWLPGRHPDWAGCSVFPFCAFRSTLPASERRASVLAGATAQAPRPPTVAHRHRQCAHRHWQLRLAPFWVEKSLKYLLRCAARSFEDQSSGGSSLNISVEWVNWVGIVLYFEAEKNGEIF